MHGPPDEPCLLLFVPTDPTDDGLTKVAKCLWAISETIELLHSTLSTPRIGSAGPYYTARFMPCNIKNLENKPRVFVRRKPKMC